MVIPHLSLLGFLIFFYQSWRYIPSIFLNIFLIFLYLFMAGDPFYLCNSCYGKCAYVVEDGNSTSFSSWISYLFLSVMEIYSFYLPEYFPNFSLLIYDRRSILLVQF